MERVQAGVQAVVGAGVRTVSPGFPCMMSQGRTCSTQHNTPWTCCCSLSCPSSVQVDMSLSRPGAGAGVDVSVSSILTSSGDLEAEEVLLLPRRVCRLAGRFPHDSHYSGSPATASGVDEPVCLSVLAQAGGRGTMTVDSLLTQRRHFQYKTCHCVT